MRHICDTTNYVCECNRAFDKETRHPQVSLIDMSGKSSCRNMATDCYAVKVVSDGCTAGKCGQHYYDFSEATMTFATPASEIKCSCSSVCMWLCCCYSAILFFSDGEYHTAFLPFLSE